MLIRKTVLDEIRDGRVTLAFRRWTRPTVRTGGTLLTAAGELEIAAVTPVDAVAISQGDARRAGFETRAALIAQLDRRKNGNVYRIEFGALRPDPRIALRQRRPDEMETEALIERLRRLDARSKDGPWTVRVLDLLAEKPAVRAADLCGRVGMERADFKTNVRKLKALGLTESLKVGYRLSPRGRTVLDRLLQRPVSGPA